MNKFILSTFLAAIVAMVSSCTKQSNVDVVGQPGSTSGGGGTTVGSPTNWNWTGTAPVSLMCNGVAFQGDAGSTQVAVTQYVVDIQSQSADHLSSVVLMVPAAGLAGHEYAIPANGSIVFQNLTYLGLTSTTGKVKIITNNSTTIEGYFFASMIDQLGGGSSTPVDITQGYFKVTKP